ncbi:MAG: DUF885 domain-containing protein [Thalassotalea sp.]|nr:DUF885 domain-containing protein [Thalassotalea sp.]MDG2392576.1 DUF885 domain-containing protein [Thalassotalea sp.]
MLKKIIAALTLALFISACAQQAEQAEQNADLTLAQIIKDQQSYQDSLDPFNADNEILYYDASPEALEQHNIKVTELYTRLQQIDKAQLSEQNQINLTILSYKFKNTIDSYTNFDHYIPLTAEAGFHAYITYISSSSSFKNVADYEKYLQRLVALNTYFEQQIYWLNKGIESGITQPQVVLKGFEDSISAYIVKDATKSDFYAPFNRMPKHISDADKALLQSKAQQIILENINPMYQNFYDYMVDTYIPNARQTIAAKDLPNGESFYQNRIEHYTTLKMTAAEIHEIGLAEVARIRAEMDDIITQVGFKGSFAEFVEFLRTDPQFYATTPEQLLKEASYIAKKMDAQLPKLFKTLPRTPYGVIAVPASIAPKYTTGRYSGPSRDDQPGNYWVNTYALDRRPLYVLEALTLHEAVPGHHLQGSIAREMENVPEFRNQTYISAFGEGWGLYSEFLGIEAGFYQDPYSDFGRLTYEMWRAVRLVVDTGMHTQGWSRQQAMDFLANNSALSLHNVQTEIDRYISWPAQALSYKLGELTIKRLRVEAETALAENFDLREFHDEVLKNGSIPLSLLEKKIREYIESKKVV